jgi:hypothetical protein
MNLYLSPALVVANGTLYAIAAVLLIIVLLLVIFGRRSL